MLGAKIELDGDRMRILGCNGRPQACRREIDIGNAGTAARFLTAALTLGDGPYTVTGNQRMRQRPIRDLIEALNQLGARVRDVKGTGCPPVEIRGGGLKGGRVAISGQQSSQYVSALLMAAPYAEKSVAIEIAGELVSRTYVEMTLQVMEAFGVIGRWCDRHHLFIEAGQRYRGRSFSIEGDASSASYFFAMAAITGGRITVCGITPDSRQGDMGFVNILEAMGCRVKRESTAVTVTGPVKTAVDVDMNTMSDVAPTLAVVALFVEGITRVHNVANMRIKECDRIQAVVTELRKLGATVEEWRDGFSVQGRGEFRAAELDTYDDHRMAMSFTLTGLRIPGIRIRYPDCVSKTFPGFYDLFLPLIRG